MDDEKSRPVGRDFLCIPGGCFFLVGAGIHRRRPQKPGIKASDVLALRLNQAFAITFWTKAYCTEDFYRYGFSQKGIAADIAKNCKSVSSVGLDNVALDQTAVPAVAPQGKKGWAAHSGPMKNIRNLTTAQRLPP